MPQNHENINLIIIFALLKTDASCSRERPWRAQLDCCSYLETHSTPISSPLIAR